MKRIKNADWVVDSETNQLSLTITGKPTIRLSLSELSQEMILALALHGAKQKIGDSYSGAAKAAQEEGRDQTDAMYEEATRIVANLRAGIWADRAGGNGGDLARAIAEVTGKPVEEIAVSLRTKSDEEKAKLRGNPKVKALMARWAAERAAAKAAAAEAAGDDGDDLEI